MTVDRRRIVTGLASTSLIGLPVGSLAQITPAAGTQLDDAARRPRAIARFVPERYDDLIWENDRVAHRIYGPALQAAEPPSGSGIDVWVKSVRWPFMDRQIASRAYHVDRGEGLDYYSVGQSRGAGGLGVWHDNKLWTSRNFARHEITQSGGDSARFAVEYAPWPVDVVRRVWERREVSLALGSSFTQLTSTLWSDTTDPLVVGLGIARRKIGSDAGSLIQEADAGLMAFQEPADQEHGSLGIALRTDPRRVLSFAQDADNHLMLISVTPGQPFTFAMGSFWDRGLDFHSQAAWLDHVRQEPAIAPW
ncbi:MAG: DUF4861 family protein [Pseudomonadota bacterium]